MGRVVPFFCFLFTIGCAIDAGDMDDDGPPDGSAEPTGALAGVFGVPNLDDDKNLGIDWDDPYFPEDNDFSSLVFSAADLGPYLSGDEIVLALTGDTAKLRVYRDTELILGADAPGDEYRLLLPDGDVALAIEFGDFLAAGTLSIARIDDSGVRDGDTELAVPLQAAPFIMNHHLQPIEKVWAVQVNDPGYDNSAFIAAYQAVLGDAFTASAGAAVDGDVWMQDEFEFATATGSDGQRMDTILDSIRDRGLAAYASRLVRPDTMTTTQGAGSQVTTYDSFGNVRIERL